MSSNNLEINSEINDMEDKCSIVDTTASFISENEQTESENSSETHLQTLTKIVAICFFMNHLKSFSKIRLYGLLNFPKTKHQMVQ